MDASLEPRPNPARTAGARMARDLLLEGHTFHDVAEALAERLGIDRAQQATLAASNDFARIALHPPTAILGQCLEQTRAIYRNCMAAGDYAGALKATKQLAELTAKADEYARRLTDPSDDF